jgi:hypothetical protein
MDQSDSHNPKAPPPHKKDVIFTQIKNRTLSLKIKRKVHHFTVGLKKMWFFTSKCAYFVNF